MSLARAVATEVVWQQASRQRHSGRTPESEPRGQGTGDVSQSHRTMVATDLVGAKTQVDRPTAHRDVIRRAVDCFPLMAEVPQAAAPQAVIAASCREDRVLTESGHSAKPGVLDRVTDLTSTQQRGR